MPLVVEAVVRVDKKEAFPSKGPSSHEIAWARDGQHLRRASPITGMIDVQICRLSPDNGVRSNRVILEEAHRASGHANMAQTSREHNLAPAMMRVFLVGPIHVHELVNIPLHRLNFTISRQGLL